jgi:hypothetical protein
MTAAPAVREVLGVGPEEQLLGWLYVGTPVPEQRIAPRPAANPYAHVSHLAARGGIHTLSRCHVS